MYVLRIISPDQILCCRYTFIIIFIIMTQELQREFALASVGLRSEQEVERKQEELEQRIQHRLQDAERERELEVRKMMQQQLAGATQRNIDMRTGKEMEHRFRMDQLEQEAKNVQVQCVCRRNTPSQERGQKCAGTVCV